jgi:hypothetical protein
MGHAPKKHPIDESRRTVPGRVDACSPQDPRTNTRPRGNGPMDHRETVKSARKLEVVLGQ